MTVREQFEFALKITTNMTDRECNEKVDALIDRLGLQACQHTLIGGRLLKGVSGGERKRTSIGYELITNPSLLFLDEPTSGLDSHTAHSITKLLKTEARRGMTILATIHQPSSSIFYLFDRIILLAEGYTIFNGNTRDVVPYLQSLGIKFGKYTNPADILLKLANDPTLIDKQLSVPKLSLQSAEKYEKISDEEKEAIFSQFRLLQNFSEIGAERKTTFLKQFLLLCKRMMLYVKRNPFSV